MNSNDWNFDQRRLSKGKTRRKKGTNRERNNTVADKVENLQEKGRNRAYSYLHWRREYGQGSRSVTRMGCAGYYDITGAILEPRPAV